jgi:uncharacterized metal-binding protein YceD (DUF177 family)
MRCPIVRRPVERAKPIENMKLPSLSIQVNELAEAGKVIEGEFPETWLGESLLAPYRVLKPVACHIEVRPVGDNVWVEGQVSMHLSFECSRTLVPGEMTINVRLSELFQPGHRKDLNLKDGIEIDDLELDGDEPYVFENGKIELEPLIREQLILAQPPYPVVDPSTEESQADGPAWTSSEHDIDPRWEELKKLIIN